MGHLQHLPDPLDNGLGHDAVGLVVIVLDLPAALRLADGRVHRGRDGIGIHDDQALRVSGSPADGLDQGRLGPEEALLVRVQNSHQAHLRQVQALPQQIDAHQHVELAHTQVPDDLHAFDGGHVRVHIPDPDPGAPQVLRQVLSHLFGQCGDQHPLAALRPLPDLAQQIVDLALHRPNLDLRVQQTRGADDLLHHLACPLPLVGPRGGGDIDGLVDAALELLEFQGAVIKGTGQAEAVLHQALLPGPVAVVHGPDLGQRHMALVHEEQKVVGEEVQQRHRRRSHRPVGDDPGVVLDAGAVAQLRHHLHIVFRPLADALGLHELLLFREVGHPFLQLFADLPDGPVHLVLGGNIVAGGVDGDMVQVAVCLAGDRVELGDAVDLIPEELHPQGPGLIVGRVDLHRVSPDPEHIALKGDVVALIPVLHQAAQQLVPVEGHARAQGDHHLGEVLRLAQAVDAADGGDHDHVPPLQKGAGGAQPQPVDLLVGGGVFFNIGVGMWDIGLRLVVVVIGHEVLHRVVGEELLELLAQLGRQGLVVGQHQGGPLDGLDDLGHGEGLAGAGDTQQHLLVQAVLHALGQLFNGLRLVAGRLIVRYHLKFRHSLLL